MRSKLLHFSRFFSVKSLTTRLFLVGVLLLSPGWAYAKLPPDTEWKTLHTTHFRFHFPASYQDFTKALSRYLEEAYGVLSVDLQWTLSSPADVVIRDDTDDSNGFTSVFPYNRIEIIAVPFPSLSSLGEYDDWVRSIAFHELTHLIANDTTRGIFEFARNIIGSAAKVNQLQPTWIMEGLAVYEETLYGSVGRGRSAFTDMVLRTTSQADLLDKGEFRYGITLDRLNDGPPDWPGGNTPYFYGYVMQEMLAEAGGTPETPALLSYVNGGRIPFFINTVADEVVHTDYYELWQRAVKRIHTIADADLAHIRKAPVTPSRILSHVGRMSGGPVLSSSGKEIYFVRDSYRDGMGLSLLDLATGKSRNISTWLYSGYSRLERKGGRLLYSREDLHKQFSMFSDVYEWDIATKKEIRRTDGVRAMDADFSGDSDALVYVKNTNDANQAVAVLEGGKERTLFQGKNFERLSAPCWGKGISRDWITFVQKIPEHGEKLMAVRTNGEGLHEILLEGTSSPRMVILTPHWEEDGEFLFTGSQSGVYNAYRIHISGPETNAVPERLTNVESGVTYPSGYLPGSKELMAMLYTSTGFEVAALDLSRSTGGSITETQMVLRDKLRGGKPEQARKPAPPAPATEVPWMRG